MDMISLFLRPQGRIAQQTYWVGFGILSVLSVAVLFIPVAGGLLWLLTLIPWSILNTKRLHDMNLSGWVQLAQYAANLGIIIVAMVLMGGAVALSMDSGAYWEKTLSAVPALGGAGGFLISGGLLAFNVLWLIWLGGSPGTPDENRYGRPTNWP